MDYQNYNHGYCPSCNKAPCCCEGGCEVPTEEGESPCGNDAVCTPKGPCDEKCGAKEGITIKGLLVGAAAIAGTIIVIVLGNT